MADPKTGLLVSTQSSWWASSTLLSFPVNGFGILSIGRVCIDRLWTDPFSGHDCLTSLDGTFPGPEWVAEHIYQLVTLNFTTTWSSLINALSEAVSESEIYAGRKLKVMGHSVCMWFRTDWVLVFQAESHSLASTWLRMSCLELSIRGGQENTYEKSAEFLRLLVLRMSCWSVSARSHSIDQKADEESEEAKCPVKPKMEDEASEQAKEGNNDEGAEGSKAGQIRLCAVLCVTVYMASLSASAGGPKMFLVNHCPASSDDYGHACPSRPHRVSHPASYDTSLQSSFQIWQSHIPNSSD